MSERQPRAEGVLRRYSIKWKIGKISRQRGSKRGTKRRRRFLAACANLTPGKSSLVAFYWIFIPFEHAILMDFNFDVDKKNF
jgi:hypothetical protein